jgi:RNA polymerase sigma factor (sigma-70 family)
LIMPPDIEAPPAPGTPGPRRVIARFHREADDLLAEFATTGRQECFEEIVRRYSAMVLNVCRQVAGQQQDAEDATQVVFLVLAERLRAGEKIVSPGRWLQQVARRAALDIRRSRSRRRRRERQQAREELTQPPEINDDDTARLVREELDRVPTKYRIPLVLHYFNGQTFAEAARELGINPSTLGVRLFRGRKMLAKRLARRGLTLSTVALTTLLATIVRKSVSDALVRSVARVALRGTAASGSAGPMAMGKGIAALAAWSPFKLMLTAALLAAAAVGARAAVQWNADGAPLNLRDLLPGMPGLRARIPHFRVDATAPARPPRNDSKPGDAATAQHAQDHLVFLPRPDMPLNGSPQTVPLLPPNILTYRPGTSGRQLSPRLFEAPPALAHRGSLDLLSMPPTPGRRLTPDLSAPGGAAAHMASTSPTGRGTPTPAPSGAQHPSPSPSPQNASGLVPDGPRNTAPMQGSGDSSGGIDDGSNSQSSLFGPNSLNGSTFPDGLPGGGLSGGVALGDTGPDAPGVPIGPASSSVVTPEPTALAIVVAAGSGLLLRRRRRI